MSGEGASSSTFKVGPELPLLNELHTVLAEQQDVDAILGKLLERICDYCGWLYAEVWLAHRSGRGLALGPCWNALEPGRKAQRTPATEPEAFVSGAWAEQKPVFLDGPGDTRTEPSELVPDSRQERAAAIPVRCSGEALGVLVLKANDDKSFPLRDSALLAMLAAQVGLAVKRKQIEDRLRESEQRFRLLVEHVGDAVFMLDPVGKILTWTPAARRILAYSQEQALKLDVRDLYEAAEAQDANKHLAEALTLRRCEVEGWRVRGDGRRIWARVVTCPIHDPSDRLSGFAQILQDRTKFREAEQVSARTTRELARSNSELEGFAAIASHDLQEPLRKIRTLGDRLKRRLAPVLAGEASDLINRMDSAACRMQSLIDELLVYSRVSTRERPMVKVDLQRTLNDVLADLGSLLEQRAATIDVTPLPTLEAEPTQMRQLFQNLLSNSIKFSRPDRSLKIKVSSTPIGDTWQLRFEDNGIGFESKYAERIFGLLQRLHGRHEYEGTGMGLAICRRIAERHRGTITAEGSSGEGAVFTVTLPRKQSIEERQT